MGIGVMRKYDFLINFFAEKPLLKIVCKYLLGSRYLVNTCRMMDNC